LIEASLGVSVLAFASASGKCLQVTYPTISLHAISRADLGPSIYCQLDELLNAEEEPSADEEDATEMRELRINLQNEASRASLIYFNL
jgi:nucleotide-sensitive chloride channel 1A